jgi:hypothetical protein
MSTATNVIPMSQPVNEDFVFARAFHALRALDTVKEKMEQQKKAAGALWSKKLNDEARSYREILRGDIEHPEKLSAKLAKENYVQVVGIFAQWEGLKEAKKLDLGERKARIAKIEQAHTEVVALSKADSSTQGDLFGKAGVIPGMGWATKSTCDAIYSALVSLSEDSALDVHQQALLQDLAGAGLETIDLGLDAASAIEADNDGEYAEAEDDEDSDGEDEGFDFDN